MDVVESGVVCVICAIFVTYVDGKMNCAGECRVWKLVAEYLFLKMLLEMFIWEQAVPGTLSTRPACMLCVAGLIGLSQ